MYDDLRWMGIRWEEGPDAGGPCGPYAQSERTQHYIATFEWLREMGAIYPCFCSRQDILHAINAPHAGDDEPVYPGTCRPAESDGSSEETGSDTRAGIAWRFRVPEGEPIAFFDGRLGEQRQVTGRDFGDFVVWRKDDLPAYQLACVADDSAMKITEVVRGADLVRSTFRQLLLYRALGLQPPAFYHCELVTDDHDDRLAKRADAVSLQALRAGGATPESLQAGWVGDRDERRSFIHRQPETGGSPPAMKR